MHASGLWSFYISHWLPKNANPSHKPVFVLGNNKRCVSQDFWKKKNINFFDLKSHQNRLANRKKLIFSLEKYFKTSKEMIIGTNSFTIFQSGWNNGVKLWAFDECPGAFPDKVTPDIDSTDEAVVQYDVLDIKILF